MTRERKRKKTKSKLKAKDIYAEKRIQHDICTPHLGCTSLGKVEGAKSQSRNLSEDLKHKAQQAANILQQSSCLGWFCSLPWGLFSLQLCINFQQIKYHFCVSRRAICFTGAGLSTAAGLGDYRGKRGKWTLEGQGDVFRRPWAPDLLSAACQLFLRFMEL